MYNLQGTRPVLLSCNQTINGSYGNIISIAFSFSTTCAISHKLWVICCIFYLHYARFQLCFILHATLHAPCLMCHAACPNTPCNLQRGTQLPVMTGCLANKAGVRQVPTLATSIEECNTVRRGARGKMHKKEA